MEGANINVLVLTREFPVGMAGTKRVYHLMDYLLLHNVIINVISLRSQTTQPEIKGIYKSIPYLNIGAGVDMKFSHLHKIILYYFKGMQAIALYKRKNYSNIVYNSGGISIENLPFIIWTKLLRYKLLLAIEEDYTYFTDKIKLISRFKFWSVRQLDFLNSHWATAVVVISYYLKNKYLGRKNTRVVLIPITAKPNHNINKKRFNTPLQVLYAGSFADKDGVDYLISGFKAFNDLYKNAQLILTGQGERKLKYQEKYKNYADIIFKGFLPDGEFYDLLRKSDVLCMCRTESDFANAGFPFKLGEYLATGNPVICTKVSDVDNYLTKDDVYLIEPNQPEQIRQALTEIISDPEQALKRGLSGLEKCKRFFSVEANGKILYDLLNSI